MTGQDPSTTRTNEPRPARIDGLDGLRATGMVLVIFAHAAFAYVHRYPPWLVWPVQDPPFGFVMDAIVLTARVVVVPMFFVVSGFFAARAIRERGADAFLLQRWNRVGVPFFAAVFTLLPLMYLVWLWGLTVSDRASPDHPLKANFQSDVESKLYGPAHLWYLEYLFILCAGYWGWRRIIAGPAPAAISGGGRAARTLLHPIVRAVVLIAPAAAVLCLHPTMLLEFRNTFIPQPWLLAYHAVFFAGGTLLYHGRDRMKELTRWWWVELLVCIPLLVVFLRAGLDGVIEPGNLRESLAFGGGAAFAWLAIFGWLGLCIRIGARDWLRRIARDSYLVYLFHMPLVAIAHVALYEQPVHTLLKYAAAAAFGLAGSLAIARLLSPTRLGRWLHGA